MKKQIVAMAVAVVTVVVMFFWWLTPVAPHHYTLHIVRGGETIEGIIKDANINSSVEYDIREAAATAVAESRKMEGGANSYLIHPGDKVAVPIYK